MIKGKDKIVFQSQALNLFENLWFHDRHNRELKFNERAFVIPCGFKLVIKICFLLYFV